MLQKSLIALSISAVLGFAQPALATESLINLESAFEQTDSAMQIALLSAQEMKDTRGAVLPLIAAVGAFSATPHGGAMIGAAGGAGLHAYSNYRNNLPTTWQGATYAAGVGRCNGS